MSVAVATCGMAKRYGRETALDGVNLRVPDGAVYVLAGANGAGKSTTLKVLMNLERADAGTRGDPRTGHRASGPRGARAGGLRPGAPRARLRLDDVRCSARARGCLLSGLGSRLCRSSESRLRPAAAPQGRDALQGREPARAARAGAGSSPAGASAGRADGRPRPGRANPHVVSAGGASGRYAHHHADLDAPDSRIREPGRSRRRPPRRDARRADVSRRTAAHRRPVPGRGAGRMAGHARARGRRRARHWRPRGPVDARRRSARADRSADPRRRTGA